MHGHVFALSTAGPTAGLWAKAGLVRTSTHFKACATSQLTLTFRETERPDNIRCRTYVCTCARMFPPYLHGEQNPLRLAESQREHGPSARPDPQQLQHQVEKRVTCKTSGECPHPLRKQQAPAMKNNIQFCGKRTVDVILIEVVLEATPRRVLALGISSNTAAMTT